jgi:hypothetical protein
LEEKLKCPHCSELYCNKPDTERKLFDLQDKYLEQRKEKYFNQMIKILYSYTGSIIKKRFSNTLVFEGALEYYTHKSVSYLVEEYLKDERFKILGSFAGFIFDKARQSIWEKREHMSADVSIDDTYQDGNPVQFEDVKSDYIRDIEDSENKIQIAKYLHALVIEIGKYYSPRENYIRLLMLNNYLTKGEKTVDAFFNCYPDRVGKMAYIKTLEILKSEIQNLESER